MRVLVTGAAGFIGSHLCESLLIDGHEVIGLDAFIPYYPRPVKELNLSAALESPLFRFVERDLRTDDLSDVTNVDAVVHLAAMPGLVKSWIDVEGYASCNLVGTVRLLDACRHHAVPRFVHASTSSVYGSDATGDETTPLLPISPYGITKLAAEEAVRTFGRIHGQPWVILRYFSVYGPRQRPDMAYHLFIEKVLDDEPVTIFGDGEQVRSITHVADCVRGTRLALDQFPAGEVFNIGGASQITVNQALATIGAITKRVPKIEYSMVRTGDQLRTSAETSKANRVFGYEAEIDPARGLASQVEWHQTRRATRDR